MTPPADSARSADAPFQPYPGELHWKTHFRSGPSAVYAALSNAEGRDRYWAESSHEEAGLIHFKVPGDLNYTGRVLERLADRRFVVEYFGWIVEFDLQRDTSGSGTDLSLVCRNVPEKDRMEITAGWVSVLMAMKASVDFGVDLRNHDDNRTWWQGYADN